jgi:hypothetical protein
MKRAPMAELTYEVSFKGVASPTLRAAFADCDLGTGVGTTWLRCTHDALRDVIARIEEFGLELLDVRLIAQQPVVEREPGPPGAPA